MERQRCPWCLGNNIYIDYHDKEWGVPAHDDRKHFEFLVLEAAQAGLSWLTILRKREAYRAAFDDFEPSKVAGYDEQKVEQLLADAGIVRNGRKIRSAVNNAARFLEVQREFGSFDHYIWRFVDHSPLVNRWESLQEVPAKTALSDEVSGDVIRRGFTFAGSTIMYAHMQAVGIVNDHLVSCFRHSEVSSLVLH